MAKQPIIFVVDDDPQVLRAVSRDLKKQYPKCKVMVNTTCDVDIFANNPNVELFDAKPEEEIVLDYPDIHNSNVSGFHFTHAFYNTFYDKTGIYVRQSSVYPELFVTDLERKKMAAKLGKYGIKKRFWIINAGYKDDSPLKDWGYSRYCQVVDRLKDQVQFVQVGEVNPTHTHEPIPGCIDLIGRTTMREYIVMVSKSVGSVGPVSMHMHVSAALGKRCIVLAGGREPYRWEAYPNHSYLHTCGKLECCKESGCWKGKIHECLNYTPVGPKCHTMITPDQVVREVEGYEKY